MPVLTLGSLSPVTVEGSPSAVLPQSYGFHVSRITAISHTAEVVYVEPVRYGAYVLCIDQPMHLMGLSLFLELAVPPRVYMPGEQPAWRPVEEFF